MNPLRVLLGLVSIVCVLLMYGFIFVAMIVLRVFPNKLYHYLFQGLYNISILLWRLIIFVFNTTRVKMVGDAFDPHDTGLVISNHVQSVDMGLLNHFASRYGPGCGHARYIVKKSVIYIPLFGQVHWMLGDVFLNRKWESDKETLTNFTKTFDRIPNKWLVLFPEGTRSSTRGKLAESHQFADVHNLPRLNHVLYPRPRGFTALVQGFQKQRNLKWVYDVTLLYSVKSVTKTPTTWGMLCGGNVMNVVAVVQRFDLQQLPSDEAGLQQWLFARFQRKERLMQAWNDCGFDLTAAERLLEQVDGGQSSTTRVQSS